MQMQRFWARSAIIAVLSGLLAVTGGCAATDAIPYPKLGSIKKVTKRLLSREEKEEAIRELSLQQQSHRSRAEQEIEKR